MYEETDERRAGAPRLDDRFADAEREVDRGEPWRFREPGMPNPLTIEVVEWSTGTTKLGEAEFLSGRDRDGRLWSVLVGSVVLRKRLVDGVREEWNEETCEFEVVETLGRAEPGEVVSVKYLGEREGARFNYPNFAVSRRPRPAPVVDDEIPF